MERKKHPKTIAAAPLFGDSNLLEIALPSELTPCYHAGWYIGYGESRLTFVNRKKPDVYLSYFTTRTVNALFRLPYTDTLLLDVADLGQLVGLDT